MDRDELLRASKAVALGALLGTILALLARRSSSGRAA